MALDGWMDGWMGGWVVGWLEAYPVSSVDDK